MRSSLSSASLGNAHQEKDKDQINISGGSMCLRRSSVIGVLFQKGAVLTCEKRAAVASPTMARVHIHAAN